MFGFGFALVPLYSLICDAAGINRLGNDTGRIAVEEALSTQVDESRWVTVEFDANTEAGMPWEFKPLVHKMKVHPGKIYQVAYYARNNSDKPIIGQAIYGITPWQATEHFNKTECFCFTQQKLEAGEGEEMPLRFVLSPKLPEKYNTITLSYTFMDTNRVVPIPQDQPAHTSLPDAEQNADRPRG